jgi:transcriptional regulator of arginine metabolism
MRIVMPTSHDRSAARRLVIRRLLTDGEVSSQAELAELLGVSGYAVSQTTVSRDLLEVGAVRTIRGDGRAVYVLQPDRAVEGTGLARLERVLREFLEAAVPSGNLVVMKVREATAGAVAAALDAAAPNGVVGTIAGDDTVLVIADDSVGGRRVADDLLRILE